MLHRLVALCSLLVSLIASVHAQISDSDPGLQAAKSLVVMVDGKFDDETQGAGVVFAANGGYVYIATVFHVVRKPDPDGGKERLATDLKVRFYNDQSKTMAAEHVASSFTNGLAVIRVKTMIPGLNLARLGDPAHLTNGSLVYAIGQPGGKPWGVTYQPGSVSGVSVNWIEIQTAFVLPGHSGGALIDQHGGIVGLVEQTDGSTAKAMRIDHALNVLRTELKLPVQLTAPQVKAPTPGVLRTNSKDGLSYAWIPPGRFRMGCSENPADRWCEDQEVPTHDATIAKGFWMGETPVTQEAYQRVTGKPNPSHFKGRLLPVESVTWDEAGAYCAAAGGLRLPTEAEWEYAARAGTTGATYADTHDVAWYADNSEGKTHEVGLRAPNAWNLRDMLGNVWQWTSDWADPYNKPGSRSDPKDAEGFPRMRAFRGGSWHSDFYLTRVSDRQGTEPTERLDDVGFRCAGDIP